MTTEKTIDERLTQLHAEISERQQEIDALRTEPLALAPLEHESWADIGNPPARLYAIDAWLPLGCVSSLYGKGGER